MASSKIMASSTSRNSDPTVPASSAIDFFRIDNARDNLVVDSVEGNSVSDRRSLQVNAEITELDGEREVRKTVDDVWREIVAGKENEQKPKEEMMTLEDFLVKAGAVKEVKEEFGGGFSAFENSSAVIETRVSLGRLDSGGFGRGRGKRSLSLLEPLDKVAQQRQKRMIKNRESAARSRERKQAYQEELESISVRLEEENVQLLKEKAEWRKRRLEQLMETVIPVVEKRRPPRLSRVHSM